MTARTATGLAVVCGGEPDEVGVRYRPKKAFTSDDGGVTWRSPGSPQAGGTVGPIAVTGRAWFFTGENIPLYVSRDGGATWRVQLNMVNVGGFRYVGFTDDDHGVALPVNAGRR